MIPSVSVSCASPLYMGSHLGHLAKVANNFTIAINHLLLYIKSELAPRLSSVVDSPKAQGFESIADVGVGIRGG